mgnify:FL=1
MKSDRRDLFLPNLLTAVLALGAFAVLPGCGNAGSGDDHDHADHDHAEHDHDHGDHAGHDHDDHDHMMVADHEMRMLGEQTVDGMTVKASRDDVEFTAGGEAPIDVWVDGGDGKGVGVTAVRFWIGTEDGRGSVKAKAAIEGDHWHTHAEIPATLPEGAKLWIEIERGDERSTTSFDLDA